MKHDVSHELRGEHGKWTKGGAVLHRMAGEAKTAAKETSGSHKEGDRVKYKTGALGTVHHIDDKGKIHVVWDKGRGRPVATPAHHLTHAEGGAKPAATEKAAREVTGAKRQSVPAADVAAGVEAARGRLQRYEESQSGLRPQDRAALEVAKRLGERVRNTPYKPPRQAGSRGGVPAPTTGPRFSGDTGFTPGKGVGGRYPGAKPASYYQGLSEQQLHLLVVQRGSQAAADELKRRRSSK